MINNIIDAISLALSEEFPEKDIYTENVEQGLTEPCFLITTIKPDNKHFFNNRYKRNNLFSIQYFPEGGRSEINNILERLYLVLEEVTDMSGESFRGSNMNAEPTNDVLHFFINYNFFAHRVETITDPMEDLQINNSARS